MRSAAASALAFVLMCACKADDQVLTPDEPVDGAMDAAIANDSGTSPIVTTDTGAGGSERDTGNGGGGASGNDAAPATDAASVTSPGQDAGTTGADAGPTTHTAKDPDCDLNGVWIARQNTESVALALGQYANNWYYLEFTQDGEQVVVSNHMDCGCVVRGALDLVRVEIPEATTRALIAHNRQIGRKGSFAKQPDGTCALQIDKFWSVRGVKEDTYLPMPRSRDVTIQQLQTENPLPTRAMVSATEDWDGDGQPGIAWVVMGVASGTRHSVQRDWTRWFSADGYEVAAATNFGDLVVRAEFSNEEVVFAESDPSLRELSQPNAGAEHTLTLRFLGRNRDDSRAQAILKSDDFQTCMAIQAALPPLLGLK